MRRARRRRRGATRRRRPPGPRPAPPCRAARQTAGQSPAVAPLRDSPVSILRWTRARRSRDPRPPAASRAICSADWAETSTSAATSGREIGVGSVQPGQQPTAIPRRAQRQRLLGRGHPEPVGPGLAGHPGALDHPVPVRVRLDHDHHARAGATCARSASMLATKASRSISADAVRGSMAGAHPRPSTCDPSVPDHRGAVPGQLLRAAADPGSGRRPSPAPRPPSTAAVAGADAGRQHGGAQPAEHVAGSGLSGPGRSGHRDLDRLGARCRHQLGRALEQHGRAGAVGARPGPRSPGRTSTSARSQSSSRASSPACGVSRDVPGTRSGRCRRPSASITTGSPESISSAITWSPSARSPQPEPTSQDCTRPSREDDVRQLATDDLRRRLRAAVADHARPAVDRAERGQHTRARVGVRAGVDADHPAGVLVAGRARAPASAPRRRRPPRRPARARCRSGRVRCRPARSARHRLAAGSIR